MQSDIKDNAADFDLKAPTKKLQPLNSLTTTFVLCSVEEGVAHGKAAGLAQRESNGRGKRKNVIQSFSS